MTDDAKLSGAAGKYAGLDRLEARKRIIADLEASGLLEKVAAVHVIGDDCREVLNLDF